MAKESQAVNVRLLDQLGVPNGHGQEESRVWEFSSEKAGDGDLCELHGERKRRRKQRKQELLKSLKWSTPAARC